MNDDWYEIFSFMGIFLLIILACVIIAFGIVATADFFQVRAFNQHYGTEYGFWEWFWCSDYIVGDKHRIEIEEGGQQ